MSLLAKCKKKTRKVPSIVSTQTVMIDGQEFKVKVYGESKHRPSSYMRTKGAQTHDAKLTAHMSADEVIALED